MKRKEAASDEANADGSGTSPSPKLGLDGDDDGEDFKNILRRLRMPIQDDADTHALGDGTPDATASPLPLPTRDMEDSPMLDYQIAAASVEMEEGCVMEPPTVSAIANEDDPPVLASRLATAFEGMEEGPVMESPTAASAPLSSASLSPTPPPVRRSSAREGLETLEHDEDEGHAPAAPSPLPHAGIEILDEEMPPLPAAQSDVTYKEMEKKIRRSIDEPASSTPPLANLTGKIFKDKGKRGTVYWKTKIIEEDYSQKARDFPTPAVTQALPRTHVDFENIDSAFLQQKRERVCHQQEGILQQVQGLPSEDAQHPSTNPSVRRQSLPAIATQRRVGVIPHCRSRSMILPMRSPPRSISSSDDVTDAPSGPTLQVEATLYEQDSVVYIGTPVENDLRPWWKKHRISMAIAVSGLAAGLAVALWAVLGFGKAPVIASSQPSEIKSFLPSLEPSRSSPPSEIPSIHPTFHPSQSVAPSIVRSAPPSMSLVPSTSPSSSSSTPPSASAHPTAVCFEGAVKIFTDSHPEDTSWTLSRITTEGVTNAQVVREDTPEDKSSPHAYDFCLESGEYEFTIYDSYGDGICCDAGAGRFELVLDGQVVLEGGEFGFSQTASFSLPAASLPPSQSSAPSRSSSPTFRPSMSFGPSSQVPSLGPTSTLRPSPLPSLLPTAPPSIYWSSLAWKQTGQTIIGEAPDDLSGSSVVLSGDGMTMAIGSLGGTYNNDHPGYVKVYHREDNASSWQDLGQRIEGTSNGKRFGAGLALSEGGKILAIGAPGHFSSSDKPGYVRVYQMEGDVPGSSWKQLGQDIIHEAGGGNFGVSIALSANGRTLAIGDNVQHDFAGLVRIYGWDEDRPSWEQLGQDLIGDGPDNSGSFVRLSESFVDLSSDGMTVAIGAPGNDDNGEDSGHVRVYRRKGDGSIWEQLGKDIDGEAPGDESGFSVSLSADGRTLAIGGIYNDGNGIDSGHARVYRIDEVGSSWEQLGQDIDGEAAGDWSGGYLSLSADGMTVAIGANNNDGNGPFSGHVKVYRIEDGTNWKQVGRDIDGEGVGDNSGFGVSLSADGMTVAIGSSRAGDDWGHVRVFNVNY